MRVFQINSNHDHLKAIVNAHLAQMIFNSLMKLLISKLFEILVFISFFITSLTTTSCEPNTSNASFSDIVSSCFFISGVGIIETGECNG
jgi:hypothetical protein